MKKWKVWVDSADVMCPDAKYFAEFKQADDYFYQLKQTWLFEARLQRV